MEIAPKPSEAPRLRTLDIPSVDGRPVQPDEAAAAFAYLVLHPNRYVGAADLIRVLWEEADLPEDPRASLSIAITRLRKYVGHDRLPAGKRGAEGALYILNAESREIDVWRFQELVTRAEALSRVDDSARASEFYEQALDLWRGDKSLAHFGKFPLLAREYEPLIGQRRSVVIDKLHADLCCGRVESVRDLTREIIASDPTNQRATELHALALFLAGDRGQALAAIDACAAGLQDGVDVMQTLEATRALIEGGDSAHPALARFGRSRYTRSDPQGVTLSGLRRPPSLNTLYPLLVCPPSQGSQADRVLTVLKQLKQWADETLGLFRLWPGVDVAPAAKTYRAWFGSIVRQTAEWDFRHYQHERFAQDEAAGMSEGVAAAILEHATRLGMRGALTPLLDEYELGIVMGGARMAPFLRTRWLADLATDHKFHLIAFAGSMRPVAHPEELKQTKYAQGDCEFDLLDAAAAETPSLFGEGDYSTLLDEAPPGDSSEQHVWAAHKIVRQYRVRSGRPRAFGYSAPAANPLRHRPMTADTLRFICHDLSERKLLARHDPVLLSTSAIYVPYQQIEAIRVLALPNDLYVETVAHPLEWSRPDPAARIRNLHQPENYLQEVRSALQACKRLADDFPEEANLTFVD